MLLCVGVSRYIGILAHPLCAFAILVLFALKNVYRIYISDRMYVCLVCGLPFQDLTIWNTDVEQGHLS